MCRESLVSHLLILLISQAAGRSPSQNRSAMAIHLFSLPALSHGRRLMESPKPLPGFGLFFPKKSPIFWGPLFIR